VAPCGSLHVPAVEGGLTSAFLRRISRFKKTLVKNHFDIGIDEIQAEHFSPNCHAAQNNYCRERFFGYGPPPDFANATFLHKNHITKYFLLNCSQHLDMNDMIYVFKYSKNY
jgi:hypothetical protein